MSNERTKEVKNRETKKHNMEIVPDFGYDAPKWTKRECANPEFADKNYHRIAKMKDEHFGSKGDRQDWGLPGWTIKGVCVGCGREFKKDVFYPD
jgi:hypothetical protein